MEQHKKTYNREGLGMEIKTLRTRYGLTQEELAHRLGVCWTTISRWERNETKPHKLGLMAIARLTDELKKKSK